MALVSPDPSLSLAEGLPFDTVSVARDGAPVQDWNGAAAMLVDPTVDLNPSNSDASQQLA